MGVVVVAAGAGTRLGAAVPKALVPVRGRALVAHAVAASLGCPGVRAVVVTAPAGHEGAVGSVLDEVVGGSGVPVRVVTGGAERPDSVRAGLAALPPDVDVVLVHDAARGLTPATVFARVTDAVRTSGGAVVPGLPVVDTVKRVDDDGRVRDTPSRSSLRAVQTPQGFPRDLLQRVHREHAGEVVTDDAGLVESAGLPVLVVPGDPAGAKVTTPDDLSTGAPTLLVLSGLPGTGKTTTARAWAAARPGRRAHLRVDTLEQAMLRTGVTDVGAAGYAVAQAVAADLLRSGLDVVADAVNPVREAREAWRRVGAEAGAHVVEVELTCSDAVEHARRVGARRPDIPGHRVPTWADVTRLAEAGYEPGEVVGAVVDVAGSDAAAVLAAVEARVEGATP